MAMRNSINNADNHTESKTGTNVWKAVRIATVATVASLVGLKVYETIAGSDATPTAVLGAPPMAKEFELFGYSILVADNIYPQFVKINPPKEQPKEVSTEN